MKRYLGLGIETLESRRLLSISAVPPAPEPNIPLVGPAIIGPGKDAGFTIHETAGVPFTAKVAFYPTPVLDPPFGYSASINWGDGTTTAGTWVYGSNRNDFGLVVSGSHAYMKAGTFAIKTQILYGPLPGSGIEAPTRILDTIASKAIVAARPVNSSGGVTITEPAGKKFTATLGSFNVIAPANNLQSTINWGDGTTSTGTLKSVGVIGIDVIKFNVTGTHMYAAPGTYPIHILVTRAPNLPSLAIPVIAAIDSTAVVTLPLAGTITGAYSIPPLANPDAGQTYLFNGSGTAGALGAVSATGSVRLPGFISSSQATGTLMLSNSLGSVTLQLTGPIEPGFGAFPKTLNYKISSGTGAYAGNQGSGKITVTLLKTNESTNQFKFVIG